MQMRSKIRVLTLYNPTSPFENSRPKRCFGLLFQFAVREVRRQALNFFARFTHKKAKSFLPGQSFRKAPSIRFSSFARFAFRIPSHRLKVVAQSVCFGLLFQFAVREGFEPSVACATHAFQACAFNRSATSPFVPNIRNKYII